ncbi:chloramphenicol 3-O phosphotransferase [Ruegeria halocynthiae]|uniref:Chloramphenicol 3-O phosphotransferase n=1 Tax=Ruegeria halocynthiae TaxID=985054 RepID=A0A1H3C5G4_9RHOB|nr:AAA family ATPase [Ruegeria halocynthiae]SDX49407.1 chloramphenicol 3-O phosphotransferase [Ruegeria halocynthiae]
MSQIIILHGPSSSGKTTLARALQKKAEVPFWHISIDHLRDSGVLPMQRFQSGDFEWMVERTRVFDGLHASLAAYANAGNNLIVEHILDTPGWLETLKRDLVNHDVLFVAVHCPTNLLIQRERARGDRPPGSAVKDQQTIHQGRMYDLEVSSPAGVEINADLILDAWRSGVRRSDFARRG